MQLLARMPAWGLFVLALVLLFAGLAAIGALIDLPADPGVKGALVRSAPVWVLVVVPVAEALLWTVLFTEGFAFAFRSPTLGMLSGLFAYSALFHASGGVLGVATSAWIGGVCGALYLILRPRSRWRAALAVAGLRWCFMAYAFYALGGLGPVGAGAG